MNSTNPIKKVVSLHDLSGYGRCSLSVILPVLSAMGVQPIPLPTAVLSTQTDGYDHYTFRDLSDQIPPIFTHWQSLGNDFDAIYTGFLANDTQADLIYSTILPLKNNNRIILVDPVFGDNGMLYPTCNTALLSAMRKLVSLSTITTPNLTEASLLLDMPCLTQYDESAVNTMLVNLGKCGPDKVVITGIPHKNKIITAYYEKATGVTGTFSQEKIHKSYPGTGDIFAATLLGCLLSGALLSESVEFSAEFVGNAIAYSSQFDYPTREGVLIEHLLGKLTDRTKKHVRS